MASTNLIYFCLIISSAFMIQKNHANLTCYMCDSRNPLCSSGQLGILSQTEPCSRRCVTKTDLNGCKNFHISKHRKKEKK